MSTKKPKTYLERFWDKLSGFVTQFDLAIHDKKQKPIISS